MPLGTDTIPPAFYSWMLTSVLLLIPAIAAVGWVALLLIPEGGTIVTQRKRYAALLLALVVTAIGFAVQLAVYASAYYPMMDTTFETTTNLRQIMHVVTGVYIVCLAFLACTGAYFCVWPTTFARYDRAGKLVLTNDVRSERHSRFDGFAAKSDRQRTTHF